MHICLLSYRGNMYCGGQGIYLYYLSRSLAQAGHKITVIVGPPYPDPMPWAKVYGIKNENFFRRKYPDFLPLPNPFEIFQPLNIWEFGATRLGIFPEMLTFSLRAFLLLTRIIKNDHIDIIHDNQCLGYGLLLMKSLGVPLLATIHHPLAIDRAVSLEQAQKFTERWRRLLYYPWIMQKLVSQRLDDIVTVSNSSAAEIEKAFAIPRNRIEVVYNGVDTDLFQPSNNSDTLQQLRNKLIFVGNTEDRKKGIMYLLHAMKLLPEKITLAIISGVFPGNGYAHTLVQKLGLEKRVHFAWRVSNSSLIQHYQLADITVVPSVYEGFGFPAAEGMACGQPVVAARAGALPEVIGNQGSGLLVEPKNATALAEGIKSVLSNETARKNMGREGRKRVLEKFTWAGAARKMLQIYQANL